MSMRDNLETGGITAEEVQLLAGHVCAAGQCLQLDLEPLDFVGGL